MDKKLTLATRDLRFLKTQFQQDFSTAPMPQELSKVISFVKKSRQIEMEFKADSSMSSLPFYDSKFIVVHSHKLS